ncbi:N-6 DNA methylase [Thermobifida halotolerans]|uniref:N-6 DNA methylase n=1 Tax=Thermobifida halotolerans TaxID=483545 RepID=A0AA97M340_9ACTN|nr:N-6 DNA methylase [Thermobifida halotolerans]UOE18602.1 N-6 DNA methylase [Thermobifida halotolerans]
MSPGHGDLPEAVVSATDIARLTGVRRPAVSNWRRRHADFPRPVAGMAANPLFSLADVEAWCDRHGRPFHASPADRLWQCARAVVEGVRTAEFLAHAGMRLLHRPADALPAPDPGWEPLLAEVEQAGQAGERGGRLYAALCDRHAASHTRRAGTASGGLADLMAELGGAGPAARVLDPACGTGALLLAAAARGTRALLAQERDPALGHIALARLLLDGRDARLAVGDTLRDDGFAAETADVVLCDPPFRDRHWGHDELAGDARWRCGLPPRGEPELAWVQHCLARTRPGGRVVVHMPAAAAHRRTGRRVRADLLRWGALRAVVEPHADGDSGAHLWLLRRPDPGDRPTHLLSVCGTTDREEITAAWTAFDTGRLGALGAHAVAVPVVDLLDERVDLNPAAHRGRDAQQPPGPRGAHR